MKNSSRLNILLVLAIVSLVLAACNREKYPMGMIKKSDKSTEYTVGADINKSPAVGVTPITAN